MLDFKEIKNSDDWELFARDFLKIYGFNIVMDPSKGPDGGKDLIVEEVLKGLTTQESLRWLVSCKHYANSEKSVGVSDEESIVDRLASHKCDGFIGFYSTLASTPLTNRLVSLTEYKYEIYDYRKIEKFIIEQKFFNLLKRYFPDYYKKNIKQVNKVVSDYIPLECKACGRDLLKYDDYLGIVAYLRYNTNIGESPEVIEDIYFACKGTCDDNLEKAYFDKGMNSFWEDLSDLKIPQKYISDIIDFLCRLNSQNLKFSDQALKKYILLNIALSQKVFRETTSEEYSRIEKFQWISQLISYYKD